MHEWEICVSEEAKAVQEVAKATGKVMDTAQKVGGFIASLVKEPMEVASGIWTDKLKYLRWERQVRFIQRAGDFLKEVGISEPTRAVPLKLALPILQGASIEEDDWLQDQWARLLVNAANKDSGVEVHRSFVSILSELSPLEAQILNVIYDLPFPQYRSVGLITEQLPAAVSKFEDRDAITLMPPPRPVALALGNLMRLGCLTPPTVWDGGENFNIVYMTTLGAEFVRACQLEESTPHQP